MKTENAKMICPFCNAYFTPEMEVEYYRISEGCDTCGYGRETSITVNVICESCGKKVYEKEIIKKD